MKDYKHDIESYIITINRRGQQNSTVQTVTPTVRLKPLNNEAEESKALHEPQASYSNTAPSGTPTGITAPLPGIIVDLKVKVGDTVRESQELAVLEAMKMENSIQSLSSGIVRSINVSTGDTVSEGTLIMVIE